MDGFALVLFKVVVDTRESRSNLRAAVCAPGEESRMRRVREFNSVHASSTRFSPSTTTDARAVLAESVCTSSPGLRGSGDVGDAAHAAAAALARSAEGECGAPAIRLVCWC